MTALMNCPQKAIIVALVFSGLCLPSVTAAMQANTPLHVGGKIRYKLDVPRPGWQQGKVTGLESDTLHLLGEDGGRHMVAIPGIRHLQVSSGQRSSTGQGAIIGGVVGAGLGLVLGIAASNDNCTGFCPSPNIGAQEVLAGAAILGGVGVGIGALIGSASRRDRWVEVSRPWSVTPAGP